MPVNSVGRKIFSDLVKGYGKFGYDAAVNVYFATVEVTGAGVVDNIGIPLIWDDSTNSYVVYVAQDIAAAKATGTSPLAGGRVLALTVGDSTGRGINNADTTLSGTAVPMSVLFRGDAAVAKAGIIWNTTGAPAQALFQKELELQDVVFVENATVVTPTYNQD